jgi:hypothetical protein
LLRFKFTACDLAWCIIYNSNHNGTSRCLIRLEKLLHFFESSPDCITLFYPHSSHDMVGLIFFSSKDCSRYISFFPLLWFISIFTPFKNRKTQMFTQWMWRFFVGIHFTALAQLYDFSLKNFLMCSRKICQSYHPVQSFFHVFQR